MQIQATDNRLYVRPIVRDKDSKCTFDESPLLFVRIGKRKTVDERLALKRLIKDAVLTDEFEDEDLASFGPFMEKCRVHSFRLLYKIPIPLEFESFIDPPHSFSEDAELWTVTVQTDWIRKVISGEPLGRALLRFLRTDDEELARAVLTKLVPKKHDASEVVLDLRQDVVRKVEKARQKRESTV